MARRIAAHGQVHQPSIVTKALAAKRETRAIEFKAEFDPQSLQAWCELLKDIVAMANTGGGVIIIGIEKAGRPIGTNVSGLLKLDPAEVTNKIHAYTGIHFADVHIFEATKDGHRLALLAVGPSGSPIVFTRPGTYPIGGGKQKSAFGMGTVYFRHGAKSEPATTADIADAINRRLDKIRREWLSGVRRVVEAPLGSQFVVLPPEVGGSPSPAAIQIRIVDDESAPAYRVIDPDHTHPYRQKELLSEMRKRLPKEVAFNSRDLWAIRKLHRVDDLPELCHKPRFGTPQYSPGFVEWLLDNYTRDRDFFADARRRLKEQIGR